MTDRLTVKDEFSPVDLLLWRFYHAESQGLVETVLDSNRGLAWLGIFPPVGTIVDVVPPVPIARLQARKTIRLYS